jgi:hypothetical protein
MSFAAFSVALATPLTSSSTTLPELPDGRGAELAASRVHAMGETEAIRHAIAIRAPRQRFMPKGMMLLP